MKKRLSGIISIFICITMAFAATGCEKAGGSSNFGGGSASNLPAGVTVVPSAARTVTYDDYNNGLVSMKIPHGWQVEVAPVDYIHYSFKVYNPANRNYMFFFGLKQEGFLKSEKARKTFASLYPDSTFAKLAAIDPQTTEGFYNVWNKNVSFSNKNELKTEYFPYLNNFNVIENLGQLNLGGDVLRATFTDASGATVQGLFTASVMSPGTYYYNNVDVAPLNVYHIVLMTAPDDDFNNWQGILDNCVGTITFSDAFVQGFSSEEQFLSATIKANQRIYDQTSSMIMDSWQRRNNSYDIISQKRSDATLGYERVYDTTTGDVYRAYNGFTDDYSGNRYQPVTDDMYAYTISGYIQK